MVQKKVIPGRNTTSNENSSCQSPPNPIGLYGRLLRLQKALQVVASRQSQLGDLMLSSTGYPALLLSELLKSQPVSSELRSLSAMISDYRMFWRMFNTPATISWGLDLLLNNANKDQVLRWADYVQAVAGIAYQLLEDVAYLASKGVLPISSANQAHLWVVSCAFWAVHVAIELFKIPYLESRGKPWTGLTLLTNAAWAPLTVHWSTYSGVLTPTLVGIFGTCATLPRLVTALRA